MATVPQSRPRLKFPRPSIPMIIAIVLVLAAIAAFAISRFNSSATASVGTTTAVTRGELIAGISATGRIEPRETAALVFNIREGRIAQVFVEEGASVKTGDPLVQLDAGQRTVEVAVAQATLAQAQADLQGLNDGATAEQVAAARAQVAAAQGALQQTQGSVTSSDIAAARAQLDEARARVATLTGKPNSDALARAEAAAVQAQATLDQQRSALSAAKEQARQNVETAANTLRNAQTDYAAARDNLSAVQDNSKDPLTGGKLTDAGERAYRDTYNKAERAMADADAALTQARITYEDAKQKETAGLPDAEAQLRSAQADLNALRTPNSDTSAAARAQLATAQANLDRLLGDQRAGALATQEANLAAAQANLNQLLADPKSSDFVRAQAQVAQAQANLDLAKLRLDETILRAPFDGIVARVDVTPGEDISQGTPVTLIDISRFQVKVTVDEVDVTRIQAGQAVQVLIDALGKPALLGSVKRIAPIAQTGSQVTSYEVVLEVEPGARPVKSGMTASATIVTDQRANALRAPSAAIRTENGASVVTVVTTGADGKQQTAIRTVQIGAAFGDQTEILSGLNEGELVQLTASK